MALAEKEPDDIEEPAEPAPAKAEPEVKEDEEGGVVVKMPEERPPKTRKERRSDHRAERDDEDRRRLREENDGLRSRMANLEAQIQARLAGVERRIPERDTYQDEVTNVRTQQETILAHLRSGNVADPGEVDRLKRQYYALGDRVDNMGRERTKQEILNEVRQHLQRPPGEYEEATLRNEFPDVIANQQAMRWATGQYHQLVAEGKPSTLATSREAMLKAAERFQLRAQAPAATPVQQQKYGGVPAQAGIKTPSNEIRLEPWAKKMAISRWPRDDENVAYAKMAVVLRKALSEPAGPTE